MAIFYLHIAKTGGQTLAVHRGNFADLNGLPLRGTLHLWVPEVWAPIMVNASDGDVRRKFLAACAWRFVEATTLEVDQSMAADEALVEAGPNEPETLLVKSDDRLTTGVTLSDVAFNESED